MRSPPLRTLRRRADLRADRNAHSVAMVTGVLEKALPPDELPPEFEHAVGEKAVVFRLRERDTFDLWPTRFLKASHLPYKQGIEIVTRDAVIRVRKYEPPWS